MLLLNTLLTILTLGTLSTSGRIVNVTAPSTAKAGSHINVTVATENYISNVDEFGIIWGLRSPNLASACPSCIGTVIRYDNIYNTTFPKIAANTIISVPVPRGFIGNYTLVAGVPSLVGASGENSIRHFTQNITIS